MKFFLQVFLFSVQCSFLVAQDADTPMSKLPKTVTSTPGQLTLFADYSAKQADGTIPVYLINQTAESIKLRTQGGDVFLKLEALNESGHWIRAQSHVFSPCGDSYTYIPILRADHFMKINGYQPKGGSKKTIRFSLYPPNIQLSSNAGDGFAAVEDIEVASNDQMAETKKKKQVTPSNPSPIKIIRDGGILMAPFFLFAFAWIVFTLRYITNRTRSMKELVALLLFPLAFGLLAISHLLLHTHTNFKEMELSVHPDSLHYIQKGLVVTRSGLVIVATGAISLIVCVLLFALPLKHKEEEQDAA